ncbi:MAG: hypothetical protein CM1200mP2_52720 [Planctomycetaceae bacterium]|nr:MAG: hypothetical protein CM1200mP2_52720 [Planctomycetaceae bacterium]
MVGTQHATDQSDQGRFARPVFSDQPENLTGDHPSVVGSKATTPPNERQTPAISSNGDPEDNGTWVDIGTSLRDEGGRKDPGRPKAADCNGAGTGMPAADRHNLPVMSGPLMFTTGEQR